MYKLLYKPDKARTVNPRQPFKLQQRLASASRSLLPAPCSLPLALCPLPSARSLRLPALSPKPAQQHLFIPIHFPIFSFSISPPAEGAVRQRVCRQKSKNSYLLNNLKF
jgi:hypothetical protein